MAFPLPNSHPPDPQGKKPFNKTVAILAGALVFGACLIVAAVTAVLIGPRLIARLDGPSASQPSAQADLPAAAAVPSFTVTPFPIEPVEPLPTATVPPPSTPTLTPDPPTPLPPTATQSAQMETPSGGYTSALFEDDFSNKDKGWPEDEDDVSWLGYHEGGTYAMVVNQPDYYAWVTPPLGFPNEDALKDIYVSFRGRALTQDGYFGIFCRFQDVDNTYEVAVSDTDYSIGKWVDGEYTPLTNPEWVETPYLGADYTQGFPAFVVSCLGDTISLEINGYGVATVTDNTYSQGGLAVFIDGGLTPDPYEGYYAKLLLDTFSASLP